MRNADATGILSLDIPVHLTLPHVTALLVKAHLLARPTAGLNSLCICPTKAQANADIVATLHICGSDYTPLDKSLPSGWECHLRVVALQSHVADLFQFNRDKDAHARMLRAMRKARRAR